MPIKTESICNAFKTVPAKHLLIIDIVNEVTGPVGLDEEIIIHRKKEINLAVAEAKAYARGTATAVDALEQLSKGISSGRRRNGR